MSDDLRTRIAAVQLAHATAGPENPHDWLRQKCKCGHALTATDIDELAAVWADHLADAVIRELEDYVHRRTSR